MKLPSLVAQVRQRTAPAPVLPRVSESEFDSDEAYKSYMKDRRKAQERLREFNRPHRVRPAEAARSTAAPEQLSKADEELRKGERRIFWGVNVVTGRKQAPCTESFAKEAAQRKAHRGKPDLQHAEYEQMLGQLDDASSSPTTKDCRAGCVLLLLPAPRDELLLRTSRSSSTSSSIDSLSLDSSSS